MERETVEQATNDHQPAEACGCIPPTSLDVGATVAPIEPLAVPGTAADQPATVTVTEPAPTTEDEAPRRTLKLVLTLQPVDDQGYRALLAIGAAGCDPVLRSATVDGLPAALDQVPALVAEAEAHWQARPRIPAVAPPAGGRAAAMGRRRPGRTGDPSTEAALDSRRPPTEPPIGVDNSPTPTEPVAPPKRAAGDQLTLFG